MAQQHLDRLTAIDAGFLHNEDSSSHMHIGAVIIAEGPPPPHADLLDGIRSRLHLVPRYRQKLAMAPAHSGRPMWVDDPSFALEYHVRHSALPRPGSEEQLLRTAARIFSQRLDRSKPLWEMWVVEGLEGERFALISKSHHALIDGVAGVDLAQVLFDLEPEPAEPDHPDEAWQPTPEPNPAELVGAGMAGAVRASLKMTAGTLGAMADPRRALKEARGAAEGLGELAWATLNPAPSTPLNQPIGPHRRFVGARHDLADLKAIKDAFGGTVNDVILTVVSGALRGWLRSRGVRTQGLELRALVPVSIRVSDGANTLGNRIAAMRGPLPVYIEDPLLRLRTVSAAMRDLKDSKQALGAEMISNVQSFAPPTILAQAARINFSTRLFNLIVTNVPGPQFPLYVQGRRMLDVFPVAFLPRDHGLAIAIMSYDGRINFGLLGDYDALPELATIGEGIEASVAEMVALARREDTAAPASA